MLIRIIPVGNVSEKLLNHLPRELTAAFHCHTKTLPKLEVPKQAFNQWRKQYDGAKMMEILANDKEGVYIDKEIPAVFITDADIYYKGMNYVFGLENPSQATAIISIARLSPEFYGNASNLFILQERILKECVHEMGHHLGLDHCRHPFCVMCFSPSIVDVDNKKKNFCANCKLKLSMKGIDVE
jgi:archaemetzincin